MKFIGSIAKAYVGKDSITNITPVMYKDSKHVIIEGIKKSELTVVASSNIESIDIHVEVDTLIIASHHTEIDIRLHKKVNTLMISAKEEFTLNLHVNNIDYISVSQDMKLFRISNKGNYIGKIITKNIEQALSLSKLTLGGKYKGEPSIVKFICINNDFSTCRLNLSETVVENLLYSKYPLKMNKYVQTKVNDYRYKLKVGRHDNIYIYDGLHYEIANGNSREIDKSILAYVYPLII